MTLILGTPATATGLDATAKCNDFRVIPLTTDKAVYIYMDGSGAIVGRVVTTSGTTISAVGSPTIIIANTVTMTTLSWRPVALSASSFVVICGRGSASGIGGAACTVSGTTITAGSLTVIVSAVSTISNLDSIFQAKVDTDKCVVVYADNNDSSKGTAISFTITGTTINTPGSTHVFQTSAIGQIGADAFYSDGTHVLIGYAISTETYAQILSVSGTTVSSGSAVSLTPGGTETKNNVRALGLTATTGLIAYELTSGTQAGKVTQVSRSGTTLTASGTINNWGTSTASNKHHGLTRLSNTLAIITYYAGTGVLKEQAKEIEVVGTSANPGTALDLDDPGDNVNVGCAVVNTTTAIAIYQTTQVAVMTTSLVSSYSYIKSAGGLAKSALGVSADGNSLFVALQDNASGNQVVFKATRPASPTISKIYDPGAGSAANVAETGNLDKMVFHGNFGSNVGVIVHTVSTAGNSDKTPTTIGTDKIQPLAVDPSDIDHFIAINQADQDALETEDGGASWATLNAALGQTPVAMGIMWFGALWPFGAFFGGNDGVDENLEYTPNEFSSLREDTSAALKAVGVLTGIDLVVS